MLDSTRPESHSRVAVQDGALSSASGDALSSGFQKSILLCMKTQALVKAFAHRSHDSARFIVTSEAVTARVAPATASFATVFDASGRAVVTRADDSLLPHQNRTNSSLHTVGPQ